MKNENVRVVGGCAVILRNIMSKKFKRNYILNYRASGQRYTLIEY